MSGERIRFEALVGDALHRIGQEITKHHVSIPTPFPTWNKLSGEEGGHEGPAKGWMEVIGGADGSGKSYLAINLAACAVNDGKKVGDINFEMSQAGFTQRYLSILSGLPKYRMEHGKYFDSSTWIEASAHATRVYEEKGGVLITNDHGVFSLEDVRVAYEKLVMQGCDIIIIDYAQLVQTGGAIFERTEQVANELRVLTHKHKVLTYALSQFNREGKKLDAQPSRHYLQGGGAWENNADQIVLIDHTMKVAHWDERKLYTRIIMDKNRHGYMPVEWGVQWDLENMRWSEGEMPEAVDVMPKDEEPERKPQQKQPSLPPHPHDQHFGKQEEFPWNEEV